MTLLAEIVISVLIVAGGLFALVGSFGLLKLPTLMMRLHGPTKATTLGVGGCLLASMLYFPVFADSSSAHELLITLFLFLTAPITANMIAKAHLLRLAHRKSPNGQKDRPDDAPPSPPGPSGVWSTLRPATARPATVNRSELPLRRPPAGSPRK